MTAHAGTQPAESAAPNTLAATADMSRRGAQTMLDAGEIAAKGLLDLMAEITDYTRTTLDRTASVTRDMTKVTSPAEL